MVPGYCSDVGREDTSIPALSPKEAAPAAPGLATADLRREHEIILRALVVLERAGRRWVARQPVDPEVLMDIVALLRRFAEQCHHGKEETHLFPSMKAKGIAAEGEIGRLLATHSEEHDYLGTLSGYSSGAERAAAALLYVGVMRQHIEAENTVIFPAADRLFTLDEQVALARSYREMEASGFGAQFRDSVLAQLDGLERRLPA
jgi:hemerythrin-like domain-containing protein